MPSEGRPLGMWFDTGCVARAITVSKQGLAECRLSVGCVSRQPPARFALGLPLECGMVVLCFL